ncbi:MAG: hypothetical protein CL811_12495 [Colwelliaceae bacterium]|nr:hypothetical protein [Colwelliaceae bacterium]|tara:strand:+ start:267 stop:701 length:435 start_codon:yes stop_codon:yes gene_type:complete
MDIINETDLEKTKLLIRRSSTPLIIKAQDLKYNRKLLEYGKFFALLLPTRQVKNRLRFLDSSINLIMARIAAKNKVSIAYNLSDIRSLDKEEKGQFLSTLKQNIRICSKAGCSIKLLDSADKKNSFSLLTSLGASPSFAKKAIE